MHPVCQFFIFWFTSSKIRLDITLNIWWNLWLSQLGLNHNSNYICTFPGRSCSVFRRKWIFSGHSWIHGSPIWFVLSRKRLICFSESKTFHSSRGGFVSDLSTPSRFSVFLYTVSVVQHLLFCSSFLLILFAWMILFALVIVEKWVLDSRDCRFVPCNNHRWKSHCQSLTIWISPFRHE